MITVDRKIFTRGVKLASSVVERRNTIPILGGLKLSANGALAIEGTDLDSFTRVELPYEGEAGEMYLGDPQSVASAVTKAGASAVTKAGGSDVRLSQGEGEKRLRLQSGALDARLATLPPEEFPAVQAIGEVTFGCSLGAAALGQIARVVPAISTEETRYYLNGVHVSLVADWTYRFVATDGHRLMLVDVPLPDAEGALPDNFILPRRFVAVALQSFAKAEGPVSWKVGHWGGSNHRPKTLEGEQRGLPRVSLAAQLDGLRFELGSKVIDGTFPDYRRVIPAQLDHAIRCEREALVQAVQSLTPLSRAKTRAAKLALEEDRLVVRLSSPDLGEGKFDIAAEHSMPTGSEIGVNAEYLLSIIGQLSGEEVEIACEAGMVGISPLVITDPADTAFKAVLMPMRV